MLQEAENDSENGQDGAEILSEFSLDPMTGMLVDKEGNPMPPVPEEQQQQQQQNDVQQQPAALPVSNCKSSETYSLTYLPIQPTFLFQQQ